MLGYKWQPECDVLVFENVHAKRGVIKSAQILWCKLMGGHNCGFGFARTRTVDKEGEQCRVGSIAKEQQILDSEFQRRSWYGKDYCIGRVCQVLEGMMGGLLPGWEASSALRCQV